MTALLPDTELPVPFAFDSQTAVLRQTQPLKAREEVILSMLAREIVDVAPSLARRLARDGRRRIEAGLADV